MKFAVNICIEKTKLLKIRHLPFPQLKLLVIYSWDSWQTKGFISKIHAVSLAEIYILNFSDGTEGLIANPLLMLQSRLCIQPM